MHLLILSVLVSRCLLAHLPTKIPFRGNVPRRGMLDASAPSGHPSSTSYCSDLIIPAAQGTTSILNSALSAVKRLILTSSVVTVIEQTTVPRVFAERNWNNATVEAVTTKGSAVEPFTIYMASKMLAKKAAREFSPLMTLRSPGILSSTPHEFLG
jgi:nucleoside-diphosphate-sugar epimerase